MNFRSFVGATAFAAAAIASVGAAQALPASNTLNDAPGSGTGAALVEKAQVVIQRTIVRKPPVVVQRRAVVVKRPAVVVGRPAVVVRP